MPTLTISEVQHIANLARLELTEREIERYRRQLSDILDYFQMLQQVDVSTVPPSASALSLRTVMRDDVERPSLSQEDALANAPDQQDGYFRVRAVFGDG